MNEFPPREVKILNLRYELLKGSEEMMDGTDNYGWCDYVRQRIVYDGRCKSDSLREVILHEIIHALNNQMQLKNTSPDDEAIAHRLAAGLMTIFVDNPELVDWLFYRSKKGKKIN
jgi:hypothetical protein